ncbi:MAG: outer membrane beta-barrel protein, partial [Prevotella sp.]
MKDKWTQQFHEKLDGYEIAAPEMEWTELDKALAKNRQPSFGVIWGRRIAAAAAVALLVIGGARVLLLSGPEAGEQEALQQNSRERWLTRQQEEPAQRQEGAGAGTQETAAVVEMIKENTEAERNKKADDNEAQIASRNEDLIASSNEAQMASNNEPQRASRNEVQRMSRSSDVYQRRSPNNKSRSGDMGGKLMAAVYMQNAMTNKGAGGMEGLYSAPVMSSPYGVVSDEFRVGSLDFLAESNPKRVNFDHDRPIKVGLSVKYNIDNRWSISSGLTYSYLRSSFDYSEGKMSGSGVQKLHYVGLPLAASYNVISAKKLKVYLTAGGEMQKLVSGKATMDGVNIPDADKKRDIREGGLQWSLN